MLPTGIKLGSNKIGQQQPKLIQSFATLTGASSLLQLAQVGTSLKKDLSIPPANTSPSMLTKSPTNTVMSKPHSMKEEDNSSTETIFVSQDQTVEIPGQNVTYVLITTRENEQQLVPVSSISSDNVR